MLHPSSSTDSPSQPMPPPRFISTSPPPIISRGDSGRGGYQIPSALSPTYVSDHNNNNSSYSGGGGVGLTTKSLIHRLRHAISMQEATLRNLREPLAGGGHGSSAAVRSLGGGGGGGGGAAAAGGAGYSTNASSHGVASSGTSSSHFHVASKRRWCPEFADTITNTMLKSISVEERWKAAQTCLDAFGVEAAGVGRSFLERYLGDYANDELVNSERSFRTETPSGLYEGDEEGNSPNNIRSTAAALPAVLSPLSGELSSDNKEFPCEWATATQLSSGSFLTITLLDCEDNAATTAASKEQQCHMLTLAVQMAILPAVLIFPCPRCIVQWRGRVLLVAASPICSGEPKRASDHTELAVVMAYLSDAFHLSRYFAPKTPEDTSEEILVAGHPSASTRLGRDGRWYLEGLSNLFPHFPPARGASISARRHMLHLRPEAVMAQGAQHWLSPAAFLMYGTRDSTTHNANVRERSQVVCQTTLHHVAAEITKRFGGAEEEGWNSTELISVLHRNGINVGFLGLVLAHVRGAASSFVFSEMLARTARDYLRNSMSRRVEVDEATKVISEFLSEISRAETFTAVWQDELFQRMATKFAAYGSFFSEHATSPPFRWLNRSYVLRRLPSLVGFQFAAGVNTEGTSPFHFPIKALLISQRCFPLPSATAPGIVGHIASLAACNEGGIAAPAWSPQYTARAQTLQRVATEIIAAVVLSDRGANATTIDAQLDRILEVADDCLKSLLLHMQETLPTGSVVPGATPEYGTALLITASVLRRIASAVGNSAACSAPTRQRGKIIAKSALQYAEAAAKILHRKQTGGKYFSSGNTTSIEITDAGHVEGHVTPSTLPGHLGYAASPAAATPLGLSVSAEVARCLEATGSSLEAMQLLDKTFQTAASMSSSGGGGGGRRGLNSTAASTPRAVTGRSATSSVEVQALSLPSGSIQPPPAWLAGGGGGGNGPQIQFLPAAAPAGPRSTSAGAAARTKMSVSIIGEEDTSGGARGGQQVEYGGGEPPGSCAASTTMPDSEARPLSRSGHDAISLSDFDNDAISQGPHNFFIARSGGGGFNAIASALALELAELYDLHGCLVEAETAHRYAHHATIALLGDDHASVSMCLNNLAVNLMSQQKYAEAEDLFRQDLALSERIFGPHHPNVSSTLNNLACLLDQLGRPSESEPLLLRDLEITKSAYGEEHPNVATACNNLAATYLRRGMLPEASDMFWKALRVRSASYGETSSPVAEVLFNLGAVLRRQGNNDEALVQWETCYRILKSLPLPPGGHATTLRLLESMCLLCEETGNYVRSEELMEEAFRLKQTDSFVESNPSPNTNKLP